MAFSGMGMGAGIGVTKVLGVENGTLPSVFVQTGGLIMGVMELWLLPFLDL